MNVSKSSVMPVSMSCRMMNGDEAEQTDRMREEGWMRPLIEAQNFMPN